MPERIRKPENINRYMEVNCRQINTDSKQNTFEISFSSEEPVKTYYGDEILVHTEEAVDIVRLADVGALLFTHGRDPKIGRMPIGKIQSAWLDQKDKKGRAIISFDEDDEDAVKVKSKMQKGMIRGVSVGYKVDEWVCLTENQVSIDGRFKGPCDLAVKWTPYEISLEPIPADPTVGLGKSIDNYENKRGGLTLDEEEKQQTQGERTITMPIDTLIPPAVNHEAVKAKERTRCTEIANLCRSFDMCPDEYIESGATVDRVRSLILDNLAKNKPAVSIRTVVDEMDKVRSAAVDGILLRGNQQVKKPADGANSFRGMRIRDVAIECLTRSGVQNANRMSDDELFRRSVSPDSAFAGIISEAVNKSMATAYAIAPTTYQHWTSKGSCTDFKPHQIYQISEAGELQELKQGGEMTFDEITNPLTATRKLLTFAKSWGFTRQAMINDDIDLLTKVPAAYVRAAQRGINKAVYGILKANPTMGDGMALFSSTHNNLGTNAKPGTASYAEAMAGMRKQKNLKGLETLNIAPKFVLSPALLEVDNARMLSSMADPSSTNSGTANIFMNRMTLIVDAEIDAATGSQPYFFAADPMSCETIEVAYLNGNEAPILETQIGFDFVGMKFRILHDRAVTLVDYRGLYKNAGSAT